LRPLFESHPPFPALPPFPTRRSSDLADDSFRSSRFHLHSPPLRITPRHRDELPRRGPARRRDRGDAPRQSVMELLLAPPGSGLRSEEHTSELQSRENLVCRLLLEKKN